MLTNAPSQLRNPSRRTSSSANEPSTRVTLPSARSALARGDVVSRVRTRTEYFPSATRSRTIGIPWAPVPPMTKTVDMVSSDIAVNSLGWSPPRSGHGVRFEYFQLAHPHLLNRSVLTNILDQSVQ